MASPHGFSLAAELALNVQPTVIDSVPSYELYACPLCDEAHLDQTSLAYHLASTHLLERAPLYICPSCGIFDSQAGDQLSHLAALEAHYEAVPFCRPVVESSLQSSPTPSFVSLADISPPVSARSSISLPPLSPVNPPVEIAFSKDEASPSPTAGKVRKLTLRPPKLRTARSPRTRKARM